MNAGKVNLGLLLIITGAAALMVNLDVADHWIFLDLLDLWPVLLIAIGLQMVLRRVAVPQLAYLSSLLILSAGAYVLCNNYNASYRTGESTAVLERSALSSSISRLDVDVELDNSDLCVSADDSDLLKCKFHSQRTGPNMSYEENADTGCISIREGAASRYRFLKTDLNEPNWDLSVYKELPVDLSFECRDSDVRLRLEDLKVESLNARFPYSVVDLKLGSLSPDVAVRMRVNRADVRLRLPEAAGLSLSGMDSTDLRRFRGIDLVRSDSAFATYGFSTAPVRYAVEVIGTPKSFTIDRY